MYFSRFSAAFVAVAAIFSVVEASATTVSSTGDFLALGHTPTLVNDDGPSDLDHILYYDELQHYTLSSALKVDGGVIAAGTMVDSHMLFLNRKPSDDLTRSSHSVKSGTLTFASQILGTISDKHGRLLDLSDYLGGTTVYASMRYRGRENGDDISFAANTLSVDNMKVSQPGDWVRVVTLSKPDPIGNGPSPVPVPAGLFLLPLGLGALGAFGRRRKKA